MDRACPPPPAAPCASCPVQRGGNAGETPSSGGAARPFRQPGEGWVPGHSKRAPGIRRGREGGGFAADPSPWHPGYSDTSFPPGFGPGDLDAKASRTSKGAGVQAAPSLSQAPSMAQAGTPGARAGTHLGHLCQAECLVTLQDLRGDVPGVSQFCMVLSGVVTCTELLSQLCHIPAPHGHHIPVPLVSYHISAPQGHPIASLSPWSPITAQHPRARVYGFWVGAGPRTPPFTPVAPGVPSDKATQTRS